MRFTTRKHRQPPAVIIISLIDILIVLLIFLMVTTTFRQVPSLKINLPQSSAKIKQGASSAPPLVVTIDKSSPFLYLNKQPVTLTKLQETLTIAATQYTNASLAIRPDKEAPVEEFINVVRAATAAGMKHQIDVYTQPKPQ